MDASAYATYAKMVPHGAALGFEVVSAEPGLARMAVAWREDLAGDAATGVIASGVVVTLIDHVSGLAFSSANPTPMPPATLDLRIDYLRPAAPRTGIVAEARCYKLTRSIGFVRAEAWDVERADLVATAQAAFILNRAP